MIWAGGKGEQDYCYGGGVKRENGQLLWGRGANGLILRVGEGKWDNVMSGEGGKWTMLVGGGQMG